MLEDSYLCEANIEPTFTERDVSDELRNCKVKNLHYLVLSDQLNACNCLIDKLHNWGI